MDRDGTLIEDVGYPSDPSDVALLSGVAPALLALQDAGFQLVVTSNQSGIGRGLLTPEQAERVHRRVVEMLAAQGIVMDGWYYCPHRPDEGCHCRKPAPGLILRAADDLVIDLARSYMVGDKESDMEAGRRAGCESILFDATRGGWASAAAMILA